MSDPYPLGIAHKCICEIYNPVVDGDTDTVYDENCEGVLGKIEDFYITPEGIVKRYDNL